MVITSLVLIHSTRLGEESLLVRLYILRSMKFLSLKWFYIMVIHT